MFLLSPLLSLVVVVFVPLFAFVAIRFRDRVFPASWNDQRLSGAVAGVVDEAVTGVRVVKAFAQEEREFDRLTDAGPRAVPVADAHRPLSTPATPRRCRRCRCWPSSACSPLGGWLALRGPHHPRRVPRLRQLPRADHHAGAPRVEHAGHHPAGPRRRRAGVRAARPAAARRRRARRPRRSSTPQGGDRARPRQLRLRRRGRRRCTTSRCASGPASASGSSARRARARRRWPS